MQTTFKIFIPCLFCFSLTLLSGCGSGGGGGGGTPSAPKLTPAEQAEVDGYIADYGTRALAQYIMEGKSADNEERLLRIVKNFVSQGADVNTPVNEYGGTPLDYVNKEHQTVIKYLESVGAK